MASNRTKITLGGKAVLVSGNPVDGFHFFGPFDSAEDAIEWADQSREPGDWWTAPLCSPDGR